jgi:hypothetical protein
MDSRRVHWQRRPLSATIGVFACGLGSSTAMRATHRIIGCTLCLAFAGSAAAASLDCQSVDNGGRAAASQSANSGSGGIGADVLGMNRGNSSPGTSSTSGAVRSSNDRSGAASSAPAPAPRPHLGWQSLLPGSIQ